MPEDTSTRSYNMKSAVLFSALSALVTAQDEPPFEQCEVDVYYANLLSNKPVRTTWTRADLASLVTETQRRVIPNVAEAPGDDDILVALVDLYPGQTEGTVYLVYRDIDFPAVPAGSPNTWRREDLWPISMGNLGNSSALTDVHGKVPADTTVSSVKSDLFFGECVNQGSCVSPATPETEADTERDDRRFAPPAVSRGDIARALFYTELRYRESLGLTLTDCPPFGSTDFGYLSFLLEWHAQDPVSAEEIARNNRTCSRWQGNRNPFVDFPELVTQLYGAPDTLVPGTALFSSCTQPTPSPTAVPNACSSLLRAGDVPVFLFNADDPDQVVFYSLSSIPPEVQFLYATDNAWTGSQLLDTEGTYRVSLAEKGVIFLSLLIWVDLPTHVTIPLLFGQFAIPEQGIQAGEPFGLGPGSPYAGNWDGGDGFELSSEGDQIFVYCLDVNNQPNFLWGFSYNGTWLDGGLNDTEYGEGSSALPDTLDMLGNTVLPHADNCVFQNEVSGLKSTLQAEFMNATLFQCDDGNRINVSSSAQPSASPVGFPSKSPSESPSSFPSTFPSDSFPSLAPSNSPTLSTSGSLSDSHLTCTVMAAAALLVFLIG